MGLVGAGRGWVGLGGAKVGWSFVGWLSILNRVKKEFLNRQGTIFVNLDLQHCEFFCICQYYRIVSKPLYLDSKAVLVLKDVLTM